MRIKFHHVLAFFIGTLFIDAEWMIGTVKIRIIDIFSMILLVIMLFSSRPFKVISNKLTGAFYVFLAFAVLNGLLKIQVATVLKVIIQLLEYIFVMQLIARETSDKVKRKEFLNVIFWMAGLVAFYSMCYHISIGRFADYKDLDAPKHSFAYFTLLGLIRYFTETKNRQRNLFILLFGMFMLLLSGERKGWAGAVIGCTAFVYFQIRYSGQKRSVKSLVTLIVVLVTTGTLGLSALLSNSKFDYLTRQFTTFSNLAGQVTGSAESAQDTKSDVERLYTLNYGIILFFKNPFTGIGIEQFASYITKASHGKYVHDAHNFYVKVLDENGLVGLFLFFTFLLVLYLSILKLAKNKDPEIALSARILIGIFFLGAIVNFFLASKAISWFYFFVPLGMVIGLRNELRATAAMEAERGSEEEMEQEEEEETGDRGQEYAGMRLLN